jgi:hypothetical protein
VSLVVLSAFLYGNALARDQDGKSMVFSLGSGLCGKMTEDVKKTRHGEAAYRAYIDGYLTAVNLFSPGKSDFFEGTDSISRYKFVLKHCEENPLDLVLTAINELVLRYKSTLY